jgi:hypothetical protein
MPDFEFDPSLSPEANIERFYVHLAAIDPRLTNILKTNIRRLLPLPSGQQRTSARMAVSLAIQEALMPPKPTGESAAPRVEG